MIESVVLYAWGHIKNIFMTFNYFHYVLIHKSSEMQEKSFLFLKITHMCFTGLDVMQKYTPFIYIWTHVVGISGYVCMWQNHTAGDIIKVWCSSLIVVHILLIICKKYTQKISCCPPVLHYSKDLTNNVNSHGHCRIIFKDSVHMKS